MKVAIFNTKPYDREFFNLINEKYNHKLIFYECRLSIETIELAKGFPAVCVFVNDIIDENVLDFLAENGTKLIATRSAGFNHIDLNTATKLGLVIVRVPEYSPYAVAEHTVGLILSLNRKIHKAYSRVRNGNFSLEGLLGFDLHGKTVGIIGTGKIGCSVSKILKGFGCKILGYDINENPDCKNLGLEYLSFNEVLKESDILTLHCPLTPATHHIINKESINKMKNGVMIINTSRGPLLDTISIIAGLKSSKIGYLGLDVYEEEADLFFEDLSSKVIQDDIFSRLLTFPNVLITGHQAFFTKQALEKIVETTLFNITCFENNNELENQVKPAKVLVPVSK